MSNENIYQTDGRGTAVNYTQSRFLFVVERAYIIFPRQWGRGGYSAYPRYVVSTEHYIPDCLMAINAPYKHTRTKTIAHNCDDYLGFGCS